ncbi:hypothetical protein [Mycobacterium uberis]|nr:hypothetical protein [Mycobacterium uberis]
MWPKVMQQLIDYNTAAIKAKRKRGAALDTVPVEDLVVALQLMTERVMA